MLEGSAQLFKLMALVASFGGITLTVYLLLRERSVRAGIRESLEDPMWSHPAVADSREAAMRGTFGTRVLAPATKNLAHVVYRFGPQGLAQRTGKRLVLAGVSDRLDTDTFFAIAMVGPVAFAAFLFAANTLGSLPMLVWLAVPLAAFFPKLWLTSRVEARQKGIRLGLADVLDLLTIAVEAGLGFDAAIARVVAALPGPLSDELYRMLQELKIGVPRAQALKNLGERTEVEDLDHFITAVSQADSFGIAIGKVLRVQAHHLRQKRSQLAEERAAKTPVKLLFPLLLCIFPALFTVLVGPAAITIVQAIFGAI